MRREANHTRGIHLMKLSPFSEDCNGKLLTVLSNKASEGL